ncbi:hypothetical protein K1719_017749 [Acacia pycnantha]|nr:hypothetical protein K1719_017749 [Acacia pycnantha]
MSASSSCSLLKLLAPFIMMIVLGGVYTGAYDDEEAAARAYDLAALKYWGPGTLINFPVSDYTRDLEEMQNFSREEYLASLRRKSSGFSRGISKYRGFSSRWEPSYGHVDLTTSIAYIMGKEATWAPRILHSQYNSRMPTQIRVACAKIDKLRSCRTRLASKPMNCTICTEPDSLHSNGVLEQALEKKRQEVEIETVKGVWKVTLLPHKKGTRTFARFSKGWSQFARNNHFKTGQTLLFKMVRTGHRPKFVVHDHEQENASSS